MAKLPPVKLRLGKRASDAPQNDMQAVHTDRNDLRRVFVKRTATSTAHIIEAREAESYATESKSLDFTRHERDDVQFDADQLAALKMLETEQYACLIGYAGTGKTTLMRGALPKWRKQAREIDWDGYRSAGQQPTFRKRPAIALCTFTNVAAKNLASKLPVEWAEHCMSIHSMLAFRPVDFELDNGDVSMRFEPAYNEGYRLPLDIIAIDETGIVSTQLWHQILDACQPHTRIYFLGDLAQLPAMHGASPMPFAMRKWPTAVLDKIYRQKEGGRIISNLTNIRRGIPPVHDNNEFRCESSSIVNGLEVSKEVLTQNVLASRQKIAGYISTLYRMGIWDPKQDMIITPQNEAMLGQQYWNEIFKQAFNPPQYDANGKQTNPPVMIRTAVGEVMLSLGDKVMATTNGGRTAREIRFNNGSIGVIIGIRPNDRYQGNMDGLGEIHNNADAEMLAMWDELEAAERENDGQDADDSASAEINDVAEIEENKARQASHVVTVIEQSTGDIYELSRSTEVASLAHAYAVTAHKFQGSQARHVLVICHSSMSFGLNREWLYTAASRAQKKVFLMHEPNALGRAVENSQLPGRNAYEKADALIEKYERVRDWAIPRLPDRHTL